VPDERRSTCWHIPTVASIVANDDGAVVGDEVLMARHVLTVDREQALSLATLLRQANTLTER
jgi:hypothetical protein